MSTLVKDEQSESAPRPATAPLLPVHQVAFQRRLTILVLSLVLVWLVIGFLEKFASILQPFFIACFIVYLIIPVHVRLVNWGVPSSLAYVLTVAVTVFLLFSLGQYVYGNVVGHRAERWEHYQQGVEQLIQRCVAALPIDLPERENFRLQDLLAP